MKKISNKLKYIIFSLVIVFAGLASSTASADTYIYNCSVANGGGTVTSTVNLTPGTAPYTFGPNASFNATGRITTSNCTVNQVSLTARNNFGADENLIPPSSIGASASIPAFVPASQIFATPANACSSPYPGICPFRVYFITGVDEDAPTTTLNYVHVTSAPVTGGTNDTNIYCGASVTNLGVPAYVDIRYEYGFNYDPTVLGTRQCGLSINPLTGAGDDYPGHEFFGSGSSSVQVISWCLLSSTVPVDPSIPQC